MTAAMSGGVPDETVRARRLAHSRTYATFALAATAIVLAGPWWPLIDATLPSYLDGSAQVAVFVAVVVWEAAANRCWRRHPMATCVRCLTDIPTDGAVQALRYARRLRTSHRAGTAGYGAVVAGTGLLGVVALLALPSPYSLVGALLLVAYWAHVAYQAASERTHLRLAPWCPYCKGGGDDGPVDAGTPLPDTSGTKVRV